MKIRYLAVLDNLSGEWKYGKDDFNNPRPYAQLDGKGELTWRYSDFKDIHIRARIGFPQNGGGRAGVLWRFVAV